MGREKKGAENDIRVPRGRETISSNPILKPNRKIGMDPILKLNKKWVQPIPENRVGFNPSLLIPNQTHGTWPAGTRPRIEFLAVQEPRILAGDGKSQQANE